MAATYTVGDGKDYATIQLAIDAIPGNLSGQGKQHVQVYAKAAGYAETLDVSTGFSNASATNYIDIEAMVPHGGMRDSGIVIDCSGANRFQVKLMSYSRFHGFGLKGTLTYAGTTYGIISNQSSYVRIYDNMVYDLTHATQTISCISGFVSGVGEQIFNNQIFNITPGINLAKTAYGIYVNNSATAGNTHEIHNNVVILNAAGSYNNRAFQGELSEYVNLSNNYAHGGYAGYLFHRFVSTNCNINYNISADGTADDFGGTGNLVNKAAATCFKCVVAGKENLDLRYTGACYREGQDNSALFTTDARGSLFKLWETGALVKRYQKTVGTSDQVSINGVKYV